jgi:hypothetical protein
MNKKEVLEYILANIEGPNYTKIEQINFDNDNIDDYLGFNPKPTVEQIIENTEVLLEKYKKYKYNLDIIKNALESGDYNIDSSVIDFALSYIDTSRIPYKETPKYISYGTESVETRLKNAEILVGHLKTLSDFTTKLPELFKKD